MLCRYYDVRRNKFLFWAIIFGFVTIFPTLYIPVINREVFKHEGITWEWAIVVIAALLFFAGVEAWKFGKRVFFRRRAVKTGGIMQDAEEADVESGKVGSREKNGIESSQ